MEKRIVCPYFQNGKCVRRRRTRYGHERHIMHCNYKNTFKCPIFDFWLENLSNSIKSEKMPQNLKEQATKGIYDGVKL